MIYYSCLYIFLEFLMSIPPKLEALLSNTHLEKNLLQDNNFYYLYKFVSFDKNLLVLESIKSQKLKYTKPKFLDDKYETDFQINWAPFLKSEGISKEMNAIYKQKHGEKIEETMTKQIQKLFKTQFGVCSLTSDPFNTSLWARYTDDNKGFLIEFKFPKNKDNVASHLIPIPLVYKQNISKINGKEVNKIFIDCKNDEPNEVDDERFTIIQKALFTKALNWKFLKEYRMLEVDLTDIEKEEKNIILRKYPLDYLSSIVLGMNITDDNKIKIQEVIDELNKKDGANIEIFTSSKHPTNATKYITNEGHLRIK